MAKIERKAENNSRNEGVFAAPVYSATLEKAEHSLTNYLLGLEKTWDGNFSLVLTVDATPATGNWNAVRSRHKWNWPQAAGA